MTKTNTRGARIPDFIIPLIEGAIKYEVEKYLGEDEKTIAKVTDMVLSDLATKEGLDWYFCAKRLVGIRHSSLCYSLAETAVTKYRYHLYFSVELWASCYIKGRYNGGYSHNLYGFSDEGCNSAKDYESRLYAFMKWSGLPDEFNYKGQESLRKFAFDKIGFKRISHSSSEQKAFWDEYNKEHSN